MCLFSYIFTSTLCIWIFVCIFHKYREDNSHDNSNSRRKDRSRVEDLEIDNTFTVFLSYVEIYNKYIYDLLEEAEYDPITLYK